MCIYYCKFKREKATFFFRKDTSYMEKYEAKNDEGNLEAIKSKRARVQCKNNFKQRKLSKRGFDCGQDEIMKNPDTLCGKCLVYIGDPSDEVFAKSVVYIVSCDEDCVNGIIINKQLFGSASFECSDKNGNKNVRGMYEDLYNGGPDDPANGFVIYPLENNCFDDTMTLVNNNIAVSTSFGLLQDIIEGVGPKKKIIAMGHCVWHRGELEWELFNNKWLIVPSDPKLLFDTERSKRWDEAVKSSGMEMWNHISEVGLC